MGLTSSESAHQELRRRVLVAILLVAALAYFRVEVRDVRSPLGESAQRNVSFGAGDLLIAWDSFSKTKRGKFALVLGPGRSGAIPAAESTSLRGLRDSGIVDIWSSELGLFHPNVEPTHVLVPPRMLDEFSSVIGGWSSRSGMLQHAAVRAAKASSIVITPSARAPLIEGILRKDLFFTYDASKVSVNTFRCVLRKRDTLMTPCLSADHARLLSLIAAMSTPARTMPLKLALAHWEGLAR